MSGEALLQVRLFNAANTGYGILPISGDGMPGVLKANARVSQTEGYGEATLILSGKRNDFPALIRRRRIEFHAVWKGKASDALHVDRMYRGIVKRVTPTKDAKGLPTLTVKIFGIWGEVARTLCYKRYANTAGVDRADFFADLARNFVLPTRPGLVVQAIPLGSVPETFDGYDKQFSAVAEALQQNVGQVVTGADVDDATGADRLFFRPYDNLANPARHTLHIPDEQVGQQSPEEDETAQATVLGIRGGGPRYSNLVAQAVKGNTSFESPVLPGTDGAGNFLTNASFEERGAGYTTSWDEINGGSSKDVSDENVQPFTGNGYVELDHTGEEVAQWKLTTPLPLVAGRAYTVDVRARRMIGSKATTGQIIVEWYNGPSGAPGTIVSTDTITINPTSTLWDLFGASVICPVGATGFRMRLRLTAQGPANANAGDDSYALLLDDARFFDPSQVTQIGWQFTPYGDAFALAIRWDEDRVSWHGSRCAYFNVSVTDENHRDAWIEAQNSARFDVVGGASLIGGFVVMVPVDAPPMKVYVDLREFNDVHQSGENAETYVIPNDGLWHVITSLKNYGQDAKQGRLHLTPRTSGQIYVDAAFVYDANAPFVTMANPELHPEAYIEQDQYRATYRADELFAPGTAIHDEAVAVGDILVVEDRQEITSDADAREYAIAFFEKYALPIKRPSFEESGILETNSLGGSTATWKPGESVRLVGSDGVDLLPAPLPLVEIAIGFDAGKLTITPYFATEPRDPYRSIEKIIKAQRIAGGTSSSSGSSYTGGTSGGGGTGGVSLTVQDEGTDLIVRAKMNFEGDGVTASDDPVTGTTTIHIPGGGGSGEAAGLTGYVQYKHSSGGFAGVPDFFWDEGSSLLGLGTDAPSAKLTTKPAAGQVPIDILDEDGAKTGRVANLTITNGYGVSVRTTGFLADYKDIGSGAVIGTFDPDSGSIFPVIVAGNERITFNAPPFFTTSVGLGRLGDGQTAQLSGPEVGPLYIFGNNNGDWAHNYAPVMLGTTGVDLSVPLTDPDRQNAWVVGFFAGYRNSSYGIDNKTIEQGFYGGMRGDASFHPFGGYRSSDGSKGGTVTDDGIVRKDGLYVSGTSTSAAIATATAAEVLAARTRPLTSPFSGTTFANLAAMIAAIWTAIATMYNRTITTGTGLTGGGDLTNDRTISIAAGGVGATQLADDAVTTTKIQDGAVTTAKMANGSVTGAKIADGTVTNTKLSDDAVTAAKIQDGAVTTAKLANLAVATGNIANDAVTSAKIADNAVTSSEIQDGAVGTTKLANLAVTTVKIADGAVTSVKIQDSAVVTAKIQDNAVTTAKIAASSITAAKLTATGIADGKVLKASGGTVVWADDATGSGGGTATILPRFRMVLMLGANPSGTGAQASDIFPEATDGSTLWFTPVTLQVRCETAPSGTFEVKTESSTGSGAFSGTNWKSVSVASGNNEISGPQTAFFTPSTTPKTGDKFRANIISLNGAAGVTVIQEFTVSTTDPSVLG